MGYEMAVAQWTAQWAADNCQRMRGQRWEQCLVFGWSFAANLDTAPVLILNTLFMEKDHRFNRFVLAFVGKSKKYQN
jgi:hypothetical protein